MTKGQYLRQWLRKADHDLTIIRQGMDRPEAEWVTDVLCFHAQQAVEKAFKAYLIYIEQEPPRTHSLEVLHRTIRSSSPDFPNYELGDLTAFAVQSRYPDELFEPDSSEAKQYAKLAEQIVNDLRLRMDH